MASQKREHDFGKDDLISRFKNVPKRQLSEVEKQMVFIVIERAKLQRERAMALLNKGFFIFVLFLVIAYLSKFSDPSAGRVMDFLFLFAIIVLVVVIFTYESTLAREEKALDSLLESFLK